MRSTVQVSSRSRRRLRHRDKQKALKEVQDHLCSKWEVEVTPFAPGKDGKKN